MKALVDADVLRYSIGFGCQHQDEENQLVPHSFDSCITLLNQYIKVILEESEADDLVMYMTEDAEAVERANSRRVAKGEEKVAYQRNYREAIATTKPYKGNRSTPKPFHYHNLTEYIMACYDCRIARGYEADDLMSIDQNSSNEDTIICSIDKDLMITPGWHYGWEVGRTASFGPIEVDEIGWLDKPTKGGKLKGAGLKFFYSQLLTGDAVDNIPGIPNLGPVKAYKLLDDCNSEEELFEVVSGVYQEHFEDNEDVDWRDYYKEQAGLLWICQEMDEEGCPVKHKVYDER